MARHINGSIASLIAASPGRFAGLGMVPLQDPERAAKALGAIKSEYRFAGVEIGSNINGVAIGDPSFDPFFEACESLGAAVFVHALKPTGMDRLVGPAPLQQVLAYPTDVGLAAASAITGKLLLRRPRLRIAFSHGGGTLAALLPRLQQGWTVFPALADAIEVAPAEQARRMYYDTLVFDPAMLRMLVATFGAERLMLGSDYPFNFHERAPVERVAAAGFDAIVTAQLVQRNAEAFLGLGAEVTR
jgi:aminocarboxymuconate-semialdehyde decarboxylase